MQQAVQVVSYGQSHESTSPATPGDAGDIGAGSAAAPPLPSTTSIVIIATFTVIDSKWQCATETLSWNLGLLFGFGSSNVT
jgi:hypothetical protein